MVTPICSAMAQSSARRHKISQMMYSYCMSAGPGSANGPANVIAEESMNVAVWRSEEHTSELQSLMRISYAVFCLKKKKKTLTILHQLNYLYASNKNKHHTTILTT